MRFLSILLLLAASALVAGCATTGPELSIHTNHPDNVAFDELHTFRVAGRPPLDTERPSFERLERITREVLRDEMTARGFDELDDGTPDLRVVWELSFRSPEGRPPREDSSFADPAPSGPPSGQPVGTLAVRMVDPVTLRVLWEGAASAIRVSPIQPRDDLRRAAWRLLAEFPPVSSASE